ncbi:UDP-glucose 4-epimerase GalE [Manganibacter manganicus]|uniref:UDP-glucose 4-epimerase n=1 Tax=Manganibacter manganicus TaxID=1873176 RepID=A0A1V8RM52_9HYPH|nr:UDP-glucose 4-epimerase GalE [Pseudaminobacter manganicus]OQM74270.1 UDP-glucose 4-epimerase GalE [Pseudaminobacter manganicus]
MTNILVVGGAGYIGSHTCLDLAGRGFTPVVYDNLSNGHAEFVKWGPLERGDIRDRERLAAVLETYRPAAIVHFAALIEVGESVRAPAAFFDNNVAGTLSLLLAAQEAGIDRLVFSSTCATYGMPESVPMKESHPQDPINPYGRSKLIVEQMLADLGRYQGLRSAVLRYFNAAGADPAGRIGEWHSPETHAIPLAIEAALGQRAGFSIFGTDYDTRDGTCVRDFIHVADLADAHGRAVEYLLEGGESVALNLGTGTGTTVQELLATVRDVSGRPFTIQREGRRAGDAPVLVADNAKAAATLGWTPRHGLESIVRTAWDWHSRGNLAAAE